MLKTSFNRSKQSWSIYCCKTCQDGKERDQPIHEIDPPKQYGKMTRLSQSRSAESNHINPITSSRYLSNHRPAIIGMNFNPNFNSEAIFFLKLSTEKRKGRDWSGGGLPRAAKWKVNTEDNITRRQQPSGEWRSAAGRWWIDGAGDDAITRRPPPHGPVCVCVCVCVCVEYSLTVTTRPTAVKEKQVYSVAVRPVSLLADSQLGKAKKRPHLKATV